MKPLTFSLPKLSPLIATAFIISANLSSLSVSAFATRSSVQKTRNVLGCLKHIHGHNLIGSQLKQRYRERRHCGYRSELQMSYNLPPGGGDKINWKDDLLIPAATVAGLGLFFISPLGGIFFAITNSLFVLSLLTPFILYIAFQGWQFFYTQESPCPNCEAPVRTLKDDGAEPTICLSCGSLVRNVGGDGDGLELCGPPPGNSFFQSDEKMGNSIFSDFFGGAQSYDGLGQQETNRKQEKKFNREQTIIDVEVERDN